MPGLNVNNASGPFIKLLTFKLARPSIVGLALIEIGESPAIPLEVAWQPTIAEAKISIINGLIFKYRQK